MNTQCSLQLYSSSCRGKKCLIQSLIRSRCTNANRYFNKQTRTRRRPECLLRSNRTSWRNGATQGTKAAAATTVGPNGEPERAGNAGVHLKRATSPLTLTGLVTDGKSLRFIGKVIRWRHVRHSPNEFRSAADTCACRGAALESDSGLPGQSLCC